MLRWLQSVISGTNTQATESEPDTRPSHSVKKAIGILSLTTLSITVAMELFHLYCLYFEETEEEDITTTQDHRILASSNTLMQPEISQVLVSTVSSAALACASFFDQMKRNLGGRYELKEDLDCRGVFIPPLGNHSHPFTGTFDGKGHTIRGLTIERPEQTGVALFPVIQSATIENLVFDDFRIIGGKHVAVVFGETDIRDNTKDEPWIVARNLSFNGGQVRATQHWRVAVLGSQVNIRDISPGAPGIIENITVENSIIGDELTTQAAGLANQVARVRLANIHIKNTRIQADPKLGTASGILDFAGFDTHIKQSEFEGVLEGNVCNGMVDTILPARGYSASITNSQVTAHFIGGTTHGIVNRASRTYIDRVAARTILETQYRLTWSSGIAGELEHGSTVSESYADVRASMRRSCSQVPCQIDRFGGIVGRGSNSTIKNCYSTGTIKAEGHNIRSTDTGGIAGHSAGHDSEAPITIINSYSTLDMGVLTRSSHPKTTTGAIAGGGTFKVASTFWNEKDSGIKHSPGGGTKATQKEMRQQAFYERHGWLFTSQSKEAGPWRMGGDEYPYPQLPNAGLAP